MLTSAELTAMRSVQTEALPDTCHILRLGGTADGMGGYVESWGTAGTAVACRFAPTGGAESSVAGKLSEIATYSFTFSQGQDVRAADRLKYGTRTFDVSTLAAGNVDGAWQTAVRVVAVEVT